MDALGRCRRNHQVPGSLQDTAWPQRLPELHIELAAGRSATDQTFHHDALGHRSIMANRWGGRTVRAM